MYLHLGQGVTVTQKSIVAVIDLDTATWSRHTRAMLRRAEERGEVVYVTDELPASAVVCAEGGRRTVYISQISSRPLLKRLQIPAWSEG